MRPWLVLFGLLSIEAFVPIRAPAAEQEYDLVVYGGTSGGISAAVQAARMGRSVVLIEPGKHLGGMTTGGLGATDIGNKARSAALPASSISAFADTTPTTQAGNMKNARHSGVRARIRRTMPPGPSNPTLRRRFTTT